MNKETQGSQPEAYAGPAVSANSLAEADKAEADKLALTESAFALDKAEAAQSAGQGYKGKPKGEHSLARGAAWLVKGAGQAEAESGESKAAQERADKARARFTSLCSGASSEAKAEAERLCALLTTRRESAPEGRDDKGLLLPGAAAKAALLFAQAVCVAQARAEQGDKAKAGKLAKAALGWGPKAWRCEPAGAALSAEADKLEGLAQAAVKACEELCFDKGLEAAEDGCEPKDS